MSGPYDQGRRVYQIAKKVVTDVVNKTTETKHSSFGAENLALFHNNQISLTNSQPTTVAGLFNCWSLITAGTNVTNRVGNEIMPRGMSLRMYLENELDRPNLHYRVIIGAAPKQRADGTATAYNNLEILDAGSAGNIVRHTSTDLGYRIFYDRVIKNEVGISSAWGSGGGYNKRCHTFLKIWIKRKRASKIIYNSSASGVQANIVNKPLFVAVIPYDSQNTLSTDQVAILNYQCKLYWKDA